MSTSRTRADVEEKMKEIDKRLQEIQQAIKPYGIETFDQAIQSILKLKPEMKQMQDAQLAIQIALTKITIPSGEEEKEQSSPKELLAETKKLYQNKLNEMTAMSKLPPAIPGVNPVQPSTPRVFKPASPKNEKPSVKALLANYIEDIYELTLSHAKKESNSKDKTIASTLYTTLVEAQRKLDGAPMNANFIFKESVFPAFQTAIASRPAQDGKLQGILTQYTQNQRVLQDALKTFVSIEKEKVAAAREGQTHRHPKV